MKRSAFAKIYADFSDNNKVYNKLLQATNDVGFSVLQSTKHDFYPQGMTAAIVLSESHVTIHTYPEDKVAYVDCFSCGDVNPLRAITLFTALINGNIADVQSHHRDSETTNLEDL
jgi:S-adenosylmethionine decarboxylase proenzyme